MKREVEATIYDIQGLENIVEHVVTEVIEPLTFGKVSNGTPAAKIPKAILITGEPGSGKKTLASGIVNELRRGRSNKRADVYYENRDVSFVQWNLDATNYFNANAEPIRISILKIINSKEVYEIEELASRAEYLRKIFSYAKSNTKGLTVILFPKFHNLCPGVSTMRFIAWDSYYNDINVNKVIFKEEMESIDTGRVLVIATTDFETSKLEPASFQFFDHVYHLPNPNYMRRLSLIHTFLTNQRAFVLDPVLNFAAEHTEGKSVMDLKIITEGSISQVMRRRQRLQSLELKAVDSGETKPVIEVTQGDFQVMLGLQVDDGWGEVERHVDVVGDEDDHLVFQRFGIRIRPNERRNNGPLLEDGEWNDNDDIDEDW